MSSLPAGPSSDSGVRRERPRRNFDAGLQTSPTEEAPFLTHRVRHHGQVTLIPPDSQGRVKKRSPDISPSRPQNKSKPRQTRHKPSSGPASGSSSRSNLTLPTQTVVDYTIPSRPRLRHIVSSGAGTSEGLHQDTSGNCRHSRPISPASSRSALSTETLISSRPPIRHIVSSGAGLSEGLLQDESSNGHHSRPISWASTSLPPPPVSLPRPHSAEMVLFSVPGDSADIPPPYTPPSAGHTTTGTQGLEQNHNRDITQSLPVDRDVAPSPPTSSSPESPAPPEDDVNLAQAHIAWEQDRRAGLSLEERVRREFERLKGSTTQASNSDAPEAPMTDHHGGVVSEALSGLLLPPETHAEEVASVPGTADFESRPPLELDYRASRLAPEAGNDTTSLSKISRPLPIPPAVPSPQPPSAYISLFHVSPPTSTMVSYSTASSSQVINYTSNNQAYSADESSLYTPLGRLSAQSQVPNAVSQSPPDISSPAHPIDETHPIDQTRRRDEAIQTTPSSSLSSVDQVGENTSPAPFATPIEDRIEILNPVRRKPPPPPPPRQSHLAATPSSDRQTVRDRSPILPSLPSSSAGRPRSGSPTIGQPSIHTSLREARVVVSAGDAEPAGSTTFGPSFVRSRINLFDAARTSRRPPPPPPRRTMLSTGLVIPVPPPDPSASSSISGELPQMGSSSRQDSTHVVAWDSRNGNDENIGSEESRSQPIPSPPPQPSLSANPPNEPTPPATLSSPQANSNSAASPSRSSSNVTTSLPPQPYEYTDLDMLISRLDDEENIRQGNAYDELLALEEIMGSAAPSTSSATNPGVRVESVVDDLPVARVQVERRRVTKDGRTKLKLSLMGVMVDRCSVCMCQFKRDEMGVLLPCLHSFHPKCVRSWLLQNLTCPLCRESTAPKEK